MKCLPENKVLTAKGTVLHDWHAEVVCVRSLNHFLLRECLAVASGHESRYLTFSAEAASSSRSQPFSLRSDVNFHMYNSQAPCGDASMELTMSAQADSTPWEVQAASESSSSANLLKGRGYFSQLGIVRRKPSRPDAPSSLSKSCSDKMSLWQVRGLLGSVASLFIWPGNVYLQSVVLPVLQYSETACARAFGPRGRLKPISDLALENGQSFYSFIVLTTNLEFPFARDSALHDETVVPSNLAVVWNPYLEENIIGGVLQGRKFGDPSGASAICRLRLWNLGREVAAAIDPRETRMLSIDVRRTLGCDSYYKLKRSEALKDRQALKAVTIEKSLQGWVANLKDEFHF